MPRPALLVQTSSMFVVRSSISERLLASSISADIPKVHTCVSVFTIAAGFPSHARSCTGGKTSGMFGSTTRAYQSGEDAYGIGFLLCAPLQDTG